MSRSELIPNQFVVDYSKGQMYLEQQHRVSKALYMVGFQILYLT